MPESLSLLPARRKLFFALLMLISVALTGVALVLPFLPDPASRLPEEGQVADRDYRALESMTYESQVLTEQRRETASRAVAPIYTSPDPGIARQQLEHLRRMLAYINSVRADTYASPQQKLEDLSALEDVILKEDIATAILELSDVRWQEVQQETLSVLETVMSSAIRPERIEEARGRLPILVSLSLPETQVNIVVELAKPFVTSNSEYSESLTEIARQEARAAVEPVSRTFVAGQTVISSGQVLSKADIEALEQLGLAEAGQNWQDYASMAALAVLLGVFMLLYFRRERAPLAKDPRSMTLIAILFLAFLFVARITIPDHTVIPYVFPLAAYGLTVAALYGTQVAMVSSMPLAILVAYGLPNAYELTFYYLLGSLFGILVLGRARRMSLFFRAGAAIAAAGLLVVLVYRIPLPATDLIGLVTLALASLINGVASASITILLQFSLAQFLGLVTPMQLVELTRPDHPLLKRLLRDAPGTYQHCLQVANLAEQAGEAVGADSLLIRAGALYHDIGKVMNPVFYIENQVPGFPNPHGDYSPQESAQMIIQHVQDGHELGRKYRLPRKILDFITEHHGTMMTRYQYAAAVKAAGGDESKIDAELFRYPGPKPQSRETAILMLADGAEARVRAERPMDSASMEEVIREMVNDRISKGQLDATKLTLRDLKTIGESFAATLRGIYHPRLQYPRMESSPTISPPTIPVARNVSAPLPEPAETPKRKSRRVSKRSETTPASKP